MNGLLLNSTCPHQPAHPSIYLVLLHDILSFKKVHIKGENQQIQSKYV